MKNMNHKATFGMAALAIVALSTIQTAAGDTFPSVRDVSLVQPPTQREVNITYTLDNGPAIVTIDVTTNGTSIGAIHTRTLSGEVNKVVASGTHTVKWNVANDWPGNTNDQVRAVVTAWYTNCPPDYMVVNLNSKKDVRWYTCEDALPGGVTNMAYRQSLLVLRKIRAAGIPWTMGTVNEPGRDTMASGGHDRAEPAHNVTLDHDYYMAIFEFTQGQWAYLTGGAKPSYYSAAADWLGRPVESVTYTKLMDSTDNTADNHYPAGSLIPNAGSYLGQFRAKTGVAFILPSEAEWEFAARAGHPEGFWGNGLPISPTITSYVDGNLDLIGRHSRNGGRNPPNYTDTPAADSPATAGGTAVVGSYNANDYGLYDMNGNVREICLDWYHDDNTGNTTGDGAYFTTHDGWGTRVARGGSWIEVAQQARASERRAVPTGNFFTGQESWHGFRVVVPTSLWAE